MSDNGILVAIEQMNRFVAIALNNVYLTLDVDVDDDGDHHMG